MIDLIQNIKRALINPVKFWNHKNSKEIKSESLFLKGYLPLVITVFVAVFIGTWFSSSHFYVGFAFFKALREIILLVVQYFVSIYLINELVRTYGGVKNKKAAEKLVFFSFLPLLLISFISGLIPSLYIIYVLSAYGIYIYATGAKKLFSIPEEKFSRFILISVILCLFVFGFLSVFLWKVFIAFY